MKMMIKLIMMKTYNPKMKNRILNLQKAKLMKFLERAYFKITTIVNMRSGKTSKKQNLMMITWSINNSITKIKY